MAETQLFPLFPAVLPPPVHDRSLLKSARSHLERLPVRRLRHQCQRAGTALLAPGEPERRGRMQICQYHHVVKDIFNGAAATVITRRN